MSGKYAQLLQNLGASEAKMKARKGKGGGRSIHPHGKAKAKAAAKKGTKGVPRSGLRATTSSKFAAGVKSFAKAPQDDLARMLERCDSKLCGLSQM
eukprot:12419641-Karenia_brevis.AAC.1